MKHSLLRSAVVLAAVIGLLTMPAGNSTATSQTTMVFVGEVTTSFLGTPCSPAGTTNCFPGPANAFLISTSTCLGEKVDVAKAKGTNVYGPSCWLSGSGSGTGACGLFQGSGHAQLVFYGDTGAKSLIIEFTIAVTGTTVTFTGTARKSAGGPGGLVTGVAQLAPKEGPFGNGSCVAGTQTQFQIAGELTYGEPTTG